MILIDDRIGSQDLVSPLRRMRLPVEECRLDFGDIAFMGKGEKGKTVNVGIELKKLPDLVQSLRTGRLSGHQVPGMLGPQGCYDYAWLLVEGLWVSNDRGQVLAPRGKAHRTLMPIPGNMSAAELEKRVLTLEICAGMHTRWCNTRPDTLRFLSGLYHWWSDQSMDKHTSHLAAHTPHTLVPLSPFRQAVCQWPGIGLRASLAAERQFGTVLAAANASVAAWAALEVKDSEGKARRLGTSTATKLVTFLRGSL